MTKIAIGMPVFNGANYISQALDSILAQTFGDFEVFISDNASDDGTQDICQQYALKDRRIRYLRQTCNVGAAANHNLLVGQGNGPYFKWASHDDILAPRFLEEAVGVLDSRPEIVLASPASALIDELGQLLPFSPERGGVVDRSGVCWPCMPEKNDGLTNGDAAVRFQAVVLKTVMCVEIYGLMRRSALMQTSLLGPFGGADKVLLAQMALLGPFWLGSEVLFHRRCHSKQFSSTVSGAYRAMWFSGRKDSLLKQQFKLLIAYCRSANGYQLGLQQRASCYLSIARRALFRGNQLRRLTSGLVGNP